MSGYNVQYEVNYTCTLKKRIRNKVTDCWQYNDIILSCEYC